MKIDFNKLSQLEKDWIELSQLRYAEQIKKNEEERDNNIEVTICNTNWFWIIYWAIRQSSFWKEYIGLQKCNCCDKLIEDWFRRTN